MHIREEQKHSDFERPRHGEVVPHMKPREAKLPFPSGDISNVQSVFLVTFYVVVVVVVVVFISGLDKI